jgi:hypothetical protein
LSVARQSACVPAPFLLSYTACMSSLIGLDVLMGRVAVLTVQCSRCDRQEQYPVGDLVKHYGRDAPVRAVVPTFTEGCPNQESPTLTARCDPWFPELAELLRPA